MAYRITDQSDKILIRLDKQFGKDAVYHIPTGQTISNTGEVIVTYQDIPVQVRSAGLSSIEISQLSQSGLGQIDAAWKMRHAYVDDVRPDHIIEVSGVYDEVIDGGASLDELGLLWTIMTRRRR
jgi:hypothetical protein